RHTRNMAMGLLGILLAGCAADRVHRQGLAAIERGDYESGVGLLQQAAHDDPRNMTFRLDLQTQRNVAVQQLVARSDNERGAQQLEAAARDYRRVLALDPSNDRAQRGLAGLEGEARPAQTVAAAHSAFARKGYEAARATPRPRSSCRTSRSSRRSTWCWIRTRSRGRSSPTTWCSSIRTSRPSRRTTSS